MRRLGTLVLFLAAMAIPASADEFGAVVKSMESHHGFRRANSRLVGLAGLIANPIMWGSDANRFQIASFENENAASKPTLQELDQIIAVSLNPNWRPLLQLGSRKDGKATSIYADVTGKNMRLLIGSTEGNSIGIVQMELDEKALARAIANMKGASQAAANKR